MNYWRFKDTRYNDIVVVNEQYDHITIYFKDNDGTVISYYSQWSEIDAGKSEGIYEFLNSFSSIYNKPTSEFFN